MTDHETDAPLPAHRFPVVPAVIWALGMQTMRQCLRKKVLLVLVFFFIIMLVAKQVIPSHNPARHVQIVMQFGLDLMSFIGVIVAIFLAATAIGDDRSQGTVITVLTKPVGRLNYLLGRIVGFAMTMGLIVAVMGAVNWGFIRWAGADARLAERRGEVLVGKRGLEPTEIHRYEGEQHAQLKEDATAAILSGSADVRLVYSFRNDLDRLPDSDNVVLEMTPRVVTMSIANVEAGLVVWNPHSGERVVRRVLLDSERPTSVSFPRTLVDKVDGVNVMVYRRTSAASVRFGRGAFQLLVRPVPFEWSYLKSLVMIFFSFMLVVVVSVAASTFLSSWVAVLVAFSAYFFAEFQETLRDFMTGLERAMKGEAVGFLGSEMFRAVHGIAGAPKPEPDPLYIQAINYFMYGSMWVLTHIFPDFNRFDASDYLTRAHDVPPAVFWVSAALLAGYGACYVLIGHLLFWRRELVP